ncbi:MAG: DNA-directed RNA polymerase subunit L [Desulfurococcaceae archaeon]
MDVKVVSKTEKELVLEIYGEDHTLGDLLMKEALRHPSVEYAAYRIPHPLKNIMEFIFVVKEGTDMSTVLKDIIERLKSGIEEFKRAVEEVFSQD